MKFFLLILLLAPLKSESYYVAIYGNNNTNDGKSISYPFRTVAHAATVMSAGDTCFIRGGTYHEIVNITDNDGMDGMPLVFTRYNNERVIFDGTVSIDSNWVQHAGNIWKTTIDFDIWQLFVDREEQVMARWPNASFSDSSVFDTENHWAHGTMKQSTPNIYGNGTLIHQAKTNDQGELIDLSAQNFDLDETNKEAIGILNVGSFRTWSRKINSHTGNTFTYDPVPQNEWKTKEHQYFLEGRLEFLDKEGEWFLDTAPTKNVLYYWAPSGQDPNQLNIRGKAQSYAFVVSKSDHVELRNLEFFGTTFYFYKSNRSKVDQCNFYYPSSSKRMLRASGQEPDVSKIKSSSYTSVTNSAFRFTDGSAIETSGGNNVIKNNYFYHIDYTSSDLTGLMVSVLMSGKNNKFQNNTMHRLGASATVVGGDSALFEYNNIYDTGHVQSDGAMIQCMTGAQPGTVIRYNWLHDSKKYGARFDGNGAGNNGLMHHNVMWNLGNSGIMAKGYEHKIFNNTVINGPGNKNDILIMIGQGGNAGSITRNNVANRISGHRSGSYQNYPVPGTYDHNENGYESGRDVSTLFIDVANLDFRPNPDSVLVDAGTVITGITDSYSGSAPDIGAYEYGGDMWSAGIDWNVETKFGSAWIDYVNPAPQIDSIVVANNNTSLQAYFNESVFNSIENQSNLEASDFALSISGGTATLASATPTAITQNGNTYTLSFNLSGTPDGSEVISVAPLANSIFDATGNQAATSQSNGSGTLNDQTKPTISAITFAADNSYIDVSFSVDVYANSNGSGALEMNDFTLSFAQNQGTATAAQIIGIKKTDSPLISSASALQGGESVVRLFISFNGTPNGLEAITIAPKDGSSIFDAAGNGAIVNQTKNSASFKDQVLPVVTINPANSSTNILRNANIIISFSEKIRNIDNSEINDVNVDSLIVLNRQNNPENSLAFDASIDTDKKVITVDPLVDFDYSETIYLSIGGFEDFGGNILTSNPSTMFNVIANVKPVAIAQDVTLNEDSKISIELKGTDSENAPLSYVFSLPRFGELAGDAPNLVYSPMADFFGPDSFRFVVNDGFDNSDSSFIKINVQPINDSPKLQLANLDTLKINQVSNEGYLFPKNNNQNSIDILSISDVDNDKIAKTIIKIQPFISGEDTLFIQNGNIYPDIKSDGSGKVFTFTTPDLIGANHAYALSLIKYKNLLGKDLTKGTRAILGFVSDGDSLSNSLSRIINLNIVNSIPEVLSESYHTLEDSAITLSLKASDKDSDLLTFNIIQDPLNGKLRGELPDVMYIPNDNFYGKDSIKYNVNDGIQNSKTASVFIHVKSLNDPPTNLSFQSPDDESEIVITINNLEGSQANFKWHQSTDPDDDKLQYLFNSWYEIIDQNGKLNTESIDSVLYNTEYSIPYKRFLSYLDKHRSPRGKFIWNVNVTDGKDTTYSNIRFTLNIEGKYIALSVQDDIIPKSYSLKQNYPNPFNPITRIQFDIPSRSKVSINIYDILGSKVTTLINQDIEPGRHVITWNAVDNNNRKLPSGLYFYQIHADSFIDTKKMILVK